SIDNGVGTVSCADGSTAATPGSTTTYTLTATGLGGSVTKTTTVTVSQHGSQTFTYNGAIPTFVVPAGITSVTITAIGARGGAGSGGSLGGNGGAITATISVTPGEALVIRVG